MSIAVQSTDKEWEAATKVRTNADLFVFLTRPFVNKETLPVKKIEKVEWIVKP